MCVCGRGGGGGRLQSAKLLKCLFVCVYIFCARICVFVYVFVCVCQRVHVGARSLSS